jgi:RNA polymerase sigma-70 factor (ECF subfamily)
VVAVTEPVEVNVGIDVDAALVLQAQRGDAQAFAELFRRHSRSMVNFAYRYVGDRGRAEELAQDVFLKLHRSLGTYVPTSRFKTFLYRVAANHCLNELRRGEYRARPLRGVDPQDPVDAVDLETPQPDEMAAARELEAGVAEAIAALPERERLALVLCRFQGLPYRDIALAMETTESAVKSLIHRATAALADALELPAEKRAAGGGRP